MKIILFSFFSVLFCTLFGQDNVVLTCKYVLTSKVDSINKTNEIYNLDITQSSSHYYSDLKRIGDSMWKDDYKKGTPIEDMVTNSNKYNMTAGGIEIYNRSIDGHLEVFEDVLSKKYKYADSIPMLGWHILNDTMTISNLNCQKAEIQFRGRKYVAWFAPSISVTYGPWKFYGLPGLIIKVTDSKGDYSFQLLSAEKVFNKKELSPLPSKTITSTVREISKLKKRLIDDPLAELELTTGVKLTIDTGMDQIASMIKKEQLNYNPIELSFDDK